MTDADVIRKAAELAGWETGLFGGDGLYAGNSDCCMSYTHPERGCLDALALQLWRKWLHQLPDFTDTTNNHHVRASEIGNAMRADSLQALRLMVEDMEGGTDG